MYCVADNSLVLHICPQWIVLSLSATVKATTCHDSPRMHLIFHYLPTIMCLSRGRQQTWQSIRFLLLLGDLWHWEYNSVVSSVNSRESRDSCKTIRKRAVPFLMIHLHNTFFLLCLGCFMAVTACKDYVEMAWYSFLFCPSSLLLCSLISFCLFVPLFLQLIGLTALYHPNRIDWHCKKIEINNADCKWIFQFIPP